MQFIFKEKSYLAISILFKNEQPERVGIVKSYSFFWVVFALGRNFLDDYWEKIFALLRARRLPCIG
jgi:hypothetical protein